MRIQQDCDRIVTEREVAFAESIGSNIFRIAFPQAYGNIDRVLIVENEIFGWFGGLRKLVRTDLVQVLDDCCFLPDCIVEHTVNLGWRIGSNCLNRLARR